MKIKQFPSCILLVEPTSKLFLSAKFLMLLCLMKTVYVLLLSSRSCCWEDSCFWGQWWVSVWTERIGGFSNAYAPLPPHLWYGFVLSVPRSKWKWVFVVAARIAVYRNLLKPPQWGAKVRNLHIVVLSFDMNWFSQKCALPFATWVMSHVLSNVVSCHCYDLRIIRHLQEPRQNPIEERQTRDIQMERSVCIFRFHHTLFTRKITYFSDASRHRLLRKLHKIKRLAEIIFSANPSVGCRNALISLKTLVNVPLKLR